jgi:Fic family protein
MKSAMRVSREDGSQPVNRASALEVHRVLQRRPIVTAGALVSATGISPATINKCLAHLGSLGVVREVTQKRRSRVYSYAAYVEILNEGTELPDQAAQS